MPSFADFRKVSRQHLKDGRVLFKGKRYKGAAYLCGYGRRSNTTRESSRRWDASLDPHDRLKAAHARSHSERPTCPPRDDSTSVDGTAQLVRGRHSEARNTLCQPFADGCEVLRYEPLE